MLPASFLMPAVKFGCSDRSEKSVSLSWTRIFLICMGMGGGPAFAGALGVFAPLARFLGGAAAGGEVTAVGPSVVPGVPGTTTVAPGAASTRVTFSVVSGSTITRAYSFLAVT